jgi:hypothetical protein
LRGNPLGRDETGLARANVAQFQGNSLDGARLKEIEGWRGNSLRILILGLLERRAAHAAGRGVNLGYPRV